MDYGHTTQTPSTGSSFSTGTSQSDNDISTFFSAGAGTENPEINNTEPENNLDLTNQDSSWAEAPYQDDRNLRNLGAGALTQREPMSSMNTLVRSQPFRQENTRPELGQIINLDMPPITSPQPTMPEGVNPEMQQPTDKNLFKDGELSPDGLETIQGEEQKLRQGTESAADFYNYIASIRENNQSEGVVN